MLLRVSYPSLNAEGVYISIKDPDPKVAKQAFEKALVYEDKRYSTLYFMANTKEQLMFEKRAKRKIDRPLKAYSSRPLRE